MRFRTYQGARPGIQQVMQAISAPGGTAYNDTMRDLAYVDSAQANARHSDSETALNQQRYSAGESLTRPDILEAARKILPANMDPVLAATLQLSSEKPSFEGYMKAAGQGMYNNATTRALEAASGGDVGTLNRFNVVAKPGETYEPFKLNETGQINSATGAYEFTPGHEALVGQREAAANASNAAAGASNALAQQRQLLEVSPGATVYRTPQTQTGRAMESLVTAPLTPNQAGAGGGAPSADMKQYGELLTLGMDAETARGVAYGTIKQVTSANGVALIDVASGQVLGELKTDPKTRAPMWVPNTAPAQPAAQQPPVPGARQAQDGNWYVQQNGQWFRVEQ